jgi:two-component system, OmpR family, sensor histidine kinase VicK
MDGGESLKPEILARLFTKFASDSYYGVGIGLCLCKKIIEAHNGRIWAKNNLGKRGCTFSFGMPQ